MITKRNARIIRGAILDARKLARLASDGWVGLQSRSLTGLYGRAYIRAIEKTQREWLAKPSSNYPPGFYGGTGTP